MKEKEIDDKVLNYFKRANAIARDDFFAKRNLSSDVIAVIAQMIQKEELNH